MSSTSAVASTASKQFPELLSLFKDPTHQSLHLPSSQHHTLLCDRFHLHLNYLISRTTTHWKNSRRKQLFPLLVHMSRMDLLRSHYGMARSRRLLPRLLHRVNPQSQLLIYGSLQARMPRLILGAENPARTLHLDHLLSSIAITSRLTRPFIRRTLLREIYKIHLSRVRILPTRSRATIPQNIVRTLPEPMYPRDLSYADAGFPFTRKSREDTGRGVL